MRNLKNRKIGFIGAGNMAQAIIGGLIETETIESSQIFVSNRAEAKLNRVVEKFNINKCESNEEVVTNCDTIFICVKPQNIYETLEPIASSFDDDKTVASIAAGVEIFQLKKILFTCKNIVRVMPNTPVSIGKGVFGVSAFGKSELLFDYMERLLSPLGRVIKVEEGEPFDALTVSCGSGVGFVYELMLYWQEWLEQYGFDSKDAKDMTVETFLGAAGMVAKNPNTGIEELQKKVTSPGGVTFAGLESMRELELERSLRYSFEKAMMRNKELGK